MLNEEQAAGGERTPKDYAIEHAGYMCVRAEALLAALHDEAAGVPEDERISVAECSTALRAGIYEFRKRRDRAAASSGASDAPQITDAMVDAYLKANDAYWREADELPKANPSVWRNGTPREATRVSLRAALTQPAAEAPKVESAAPIAGVDDMAALIRQLVRSLRKAAPDNALADRALDYLKRTDMQGSPLRSTPPSNDQIERHTLLAKDCPPDSKVMLVNSIRRLRDRAALAQPSEAPKVEAPTGAIVNGRICIERLEQYGFDCEAGGLAMCDDWQRLRQCFEYLAAHFEGIEASTTKAEAPKLYFGHSPTQRWTRESIEASTTKGKS